MNLRLAQAAQALGVPLVGGDGEICASPPIAATCVRGIYLLRCVASVLMRMTLWHKPCRWCGRCGRGGGF